MSDLNGYKLTKAWFDFTRSGVVITRPVHTALYVYCVQLCNELKWPNIYGLPTDNTMNAIGISNYKTFINTLTDLIDFGFIILHEKSKNQFTSNKIALVKNTKASPKHIPKQVQSIVSISKHVNNKNVLKVDKKTGLIDFFQKVRPDVPRETLEIEAAKFINKYPDKEGEINLINTWASKIKFAPQKSATDEFDKIAKQNKEKYGTN